MYKIDEKYIRGFKKVENKEDIRKTEYYEKIKDRFIDVTMSCDKEEINDNIVFEIKNIFEKGKLNGGKYNFNLRAEFIMLMDIYFSINKMVI